MSGLAFKYQTPFFEFIELAGLLCGACFSVLCCAHRCPQQGCSMARRYPTKSKTSGVTDSERTLIFQPHVGSGGGGETWTKGKRRSAYFAEDSASEASILLEQQQPLPLVPQRGFTRATNTSDSDCGRRVAASSSRTGGRRLLLEGIRDGTQQGKYDFKMPQRRCVEGNNSNSGRATRHSGTKTDNREDGVVEPVFFGSIRFPASRVELW